MQGLLHTRVDSCTHMSKLSVHTPADSGSPASPGSWALRTCSTAHTTEGMSWEAPADPEGGWGVCTGNSRIWVPGVVAGGGSALGEQAFLALASVRREGGPNGVL